MHIGVFSTTKTNRLSYVLDFIFGHFFDLKYTFHTNLQDFKDYEGPKIAYSSVDIENTIGIVPHTILFEASIKEQNIYLEYWDQTPCIFKTGNKENKFAVDVFALAFYYLSRYEEYLSFDADQYGRFPGKKSFSYQHRIHDIPILDHWLCKLQTILKQNYPSHKFPIKQYPNCIPSLDIDHPWEIQYLPQYLQAGKIAKSFVSLRWKKTYHHIKTIFRKEKDAFDNYTYIQNIFGKYTDVKIFILLRNSVFPDQNRHILHPKFKELVNSLQAQFELGMHPSISSGQNSTIFHEELKLFQQLTDKKARISRQHYLVLKFPQTYRQLLKCGIQQDYSMGFHDICGFRAGTSRPFYWYDLTKEKSSELKIHPFQWMDVSLKRSSENSVPKALATISKIKNEIQKTAGSVCFIWHNSSFDSMSGWNNWQEVFEESLKE